MHKIIKIYTLADPISLKVRYVGKTVYPLEIRLRKHLVTYEKNHRANWIRSLTKNNLKPIIELIEEVEESDWKFWEMYWIEQLNQWGFKLINATKGGESGIISKQCREACIKANTGMKHNRESVNKRVDFLKKPVGQFNKKNELITIHESASEAARKVGGCLSHITECCNKKPKRKSHKSYIWKYV